MRTQSVAGEVVLVRPRADHGVCVGHRDEIALGSFVHFLSTALWRGSRQDGLALVELIGLARKSNDNNALA